MARRDLPVSFSVVGSGPEHLGAPPTFKDPAPLRRLSVVTPALLCPRVTLISDATFSGIHSKAQQSRSQTPARLLSHLRPLQPPSSPPFMSGRIHRRRFTPRGVYCRSVACLLGTQTLAEINQDSFPPINTRRFVVSEKAHHDSLPISSSVCLRVAGPAGPTKCSLLS